MEKGKELTELREHVEDLDGTVFFSGEDENTIDKYKQSLKDEEAIEKLKYASYYESKDIFSYMDDPSSLMDSVVDACCSQGCQVEPDGHCMHGHPSVLLDNDLI